MSDRILNVQCGFVVSNCEEGGLETDVAAGFVALAFAALALAAAALLSAVELFDFGSFVGDRALSFEKTFRSAISVSFIEFANAHCDGVRGQLLRRTVASIMYLCG